MTGKTGCTQQEARQAMKQVCPGITVKRILLADEGRILQALELLERLEDYQKYANSGADAPWLER